MQSPPFPHYLVPPRSKYSPQHHVLKHPQLFCSLTIAQMELIVAFPWHHWAPFYCLQLHVGQQYKKDALLHFHSKHRHANAPQYYILWTLPSLFFTSYIRILGTALAQCLRCCDTNPKVAISIPAGVSGFFVDIKFFQSHVGHGIDSASNRNESQEYFLGLKAAGAKDWQPTTILCRCHEIREP